MRLFIIRSYLSDSNLGNWIFFLASFKGSNILALKCKNNSVFSANSPLSKAETHPDFQVTSCHQNDSTNVILPMSSPNRLWHYTVNL